MTLEEVLRKSTRCCRFYRLYPAETAHLLAAANRTLENVVMVTDVEDRLDQEIHLVRQILAYANDSGDADRLRAIGQIELSLVAASMIRAFCKN